MKNRRCGCGHPRAAHEHYRGGTDCSRCPCGRFSWRWNPRSWSWGWAAALAEGAADALDDL